MTGISPARNGEPRTQAHRYPAWPSHAARGNVRAARLVPVVAVAALVLAGCSSTQDAATATTAGPASPSTTTTPVGPSTTGTMAPVTADAAWAHVHNLTLDGQQLLIGTHEGLWGQLPGQPATQVSDQPFDVMGFARAGTSTMLASGHPGEGQDAPADLGLQASTDGGKTWNPVSLAGQVDFHRLRAAGTVVQGLSAHDGKFLRSTDAGKTWTDLGTPPLYDFDLDPTNPDHLIGTTQSGPVNSTDGGTTLKPIKDAPLLALLAWTGKKIYAIAADGTLQKSTDGGKTWKQITQLEGIPQALAADGDHVVALTGSTIWDSTDGGKTFTQRITGIAAGH